MRQDPAPLRVRPLEVRVEEPVHDARQVPEPRRLPVRDEEHLPRDLQRRVVLTRERRVCELVELAPHGRPRDGRLVSGVLPVRLDLVSIRGRGDVRPERARKRGGDTSALRRRVDGGEPDVELVLEALDVLLGVRDELVGGEEVCVGAVADVRPVEEVRVVADLNVRLAALPRLEKPRNELSVAGPGRGIGPQCERDALDRKTQKGLTRRCLLAVVRQCRDRPCRLLQ